MERFDLRNETTKSICAYGSAAAISISAAFFLLELWKADLRVPFDYDGDSLLYSLMIKSTLDHGWFWTNPSVGAPGALLLYDFPASAHDSFHLLVIKLMSVFTSDWALLTNLYFLLGFPLTALSAMAVSRHFGIGRRTAIVGSVLYAFLPGRLLKGETHVFMDVFYQVPLAILVVLWVCGDRPPLLQANATGKRSIALTLRDTRSYVALAICALSASTSLYYAFFTACLLLAGGAWASIERRTLRNLVSGALLAFAIGVGLAVNALPSIVYTARHGPNLEVAHRKPIEAEYYGLKITQLLLPADGHRIPAFERLKREYNSTAPLVNENRFASLGLIGSAGFLALLGFAVTGRRTRHAPEQWLRPLGVLNLIAVLLGTIGGLGALMALIVTPQIRSYCRISVLIGFLSLFAVMILLECVRRPRPVLTSILLPMLLLLGLFDQVTPLAVRDYAATKSEYASDADLVRRIEAALPNRAAILELPFMPFPETAPVHRMSGYAPVRFYLHSRTLRWSYPAMRGRGRVGASEAAALEPSTIAGVLKSVGFGGILIDRHGYVDGGGAIESAFSETLNSVPIVSNNGRVSFFDLTR
jgi:phosphoglycerol transferase